MKTEEISFDSIVQRLNFPEGKSKWDKCKKFTQDVASTVKDRSIEFVKGFYNHIESIAILTLSAFGISALLGEIPFWIMLPMWIEAAMVIPVIAVLLVAGLVTLGEKRTKKRLAYA